MFLILRNQQISICSEEGIHMVSLNSNQSTYLIGIVPNIQNDLSSLVSTIRHEGDPYEGTNLDSITERPSLVVDPCDRDYGKCKTTRLRDCVGSRLRMFQAKPGVKGCANALASGAVIGGLVATENSCLYVVVLNLAERRSSRIGKIYASVSF